MRQQITTECERIDAEITVAAAFPTNLGAATWDFAVRTRAFEVDGRDVDLEVTLTSGQPLPFFWQNHINSPGGGSTEIGHESRPMSLRRDI
jgi:hypothetical protein